MIDSFDQSTGVIKFKPKPKPVKERIKTVADILADNGYTQERFDQLCKDLSDDEKAYRLLKLLAVSLNEGWQPDWNNDNQYKYYPRGSTWAVLPAFGCSAAMAGARARLSALAFALSRVKLASMQVSNSRSYIRNIL
jgi:hypothetical protein